MRNRYLTASALLLVIVESAAWCQATNSYRYDSLGRLIISSTNGAPGGSKTTTIGYDPAGNRASYKVVGGSTSTPTPTPSSSAPTALNPTLNFSSSGSYMIALSTLATSGSPAQIISFSVPSGGGSATVAGGGQSVSYTAPYIARAPMCEPGDTQVFSVPYSVQTTSGGPSASGTATIVVTGPAGLTPKRGQMCP